MQLAAARIRRGHSDCSQGTRGEERSLLVPSFLTSPETLGAKGKKTQHEKCRDQSGGCHPAENVTVHLLWFVSASVPGDPQLLQVCGEKPDHQHRLSFKAGHLIRSAEDTSCVSAAKGDTGGFGGVSSQPYFRYTPADYKVRCYPAFSPPKHVCQQEYLIQVSLPHKLFLVNG